MDSGGNDELLNHIREEINYKYIHIPASLGYTV